MQTRTYSCRHRGGFSLVELLIVIAVIGVIAAMGMLSMTNVSENSSVVTAKSQAQQIAATFGAGIATGAPVFKTADSVDSAMNAVGIGSTGAGIHQTSFFQVKGVSSTMDEEKPTEQQIKHYLSWEGGTLIYNATGRPSFDLTGWVEVGYYETAALAQEGVTSNSAQFPHNEYMAIGNYVYARSRNQPNVI